MMQETQNKDLEIQGECLCLGLLKHTQPSGDVTIPSGVMAA